MRPIDRKTRIREYKEEKQPAGIYQVRNTVNGRVLMGSTMNLAGTLNRHRFQLKMGSHPNADLQADWQEFGPEAFEFGVLDTLKQPDEPSYDAREDLKVLLQMWLERLEESGVKLYGAPASR